MEEVNLEKKEDVIKSQASTVQNYNKSGQPGFDTTNLNVQPDHKNWGLLRCVSLTNNY